MSEWDDILVKLWTKRKSLGDDMLDKCVTVCRIKVYFCVGRVLPKMSLSHHNTLYLKQPLLKATRFIPLRQLKLPFGLWSVLDWPCPLCLLRGFGYISGSCCSILWMLWLFALPVHGVPARVWLIAIGSGIIRTCSWSCEPNVRVWVMTCWTSAWQFAG